jgi:hypothetical protein
VKVRRILVEAGVFLLTAVALGAGEIAGNLLKNGDFEIGEAGVASKGKLPVGWRKPYAMASVLEIVNDTRPFSPGKQCLKIDTSEAAKSGGLYSELVPIDPKKPLKVSGWLRYSGKLENGWLGVYVGVGWYDKDSKPILDEQKINYEYIPWYGGNLEPGWYKFEATFSLQGNEYGVAKIPPDAAFVDVMSFTLNYPRPVWFDDITVSQEK